MPEVHSPDPNPNRRRHHGERDTSHSTGDTTGQNVRELIDCICDLRDTRDLRPSTAALFTTLGFIAPVDEQSSLQLRADLEKERARLQNQIESLSTVNSILKEQQADLHRLELSWFHGLTGGLFCWGITHRRRSKGDLMMKNLDQAMEISEKLKNLDANDHAIGTNLGAFAVSKNARAQMRELEVSKHPDQLLDMLTVAAASAEPERLGSTMLTHYGRITSKSNALPNDTQRSILNRLSLIAAIAPSEFEELINESRFNQWIRLEAARAIHIDYLCASSEPAQRRALAGLAAKGHPDSSPFRTLEERDESLRQTNSIQTRALSYALHFERMKVEMRRFPDGDLPLAAQFLCDASNKPFGVQARGRDYYPGGGFWANGISLEKLLAPLGGDATETKKLYYDRLGYYRDAFANLDYFRLGFLRGMLVLGFSDERKVPIEGKSFSLVLLNDHFTSFRNLVFCVESKSIWPLIEQCSANLLDYTNRQPGKDLSAHADEILKVLSGRAPGLVLEVDSPSCVFGSLSNAFPPGNGQGHTDLWGRRHKFYSIRSDGDNDGLQIFRDRHNEVYATSKALLDCADLAMLLYAQWKANGTPNSPAVPRMLSALYKFEQAYDFSSLAIGTASPIRWDEKPTPIVTGKGLSILDASGGEIHLPWSSEGPDQQAIDLWAQHVQPQYLASGAVDLQKGLCLVTDS